ncbi:MAG: response regulator [Candidatus Omnitrophota bacterium]
MDDFVEILLVEDNPNDVELTLRALKKNNLANKVLVVTDGAQALDFIFCTGAYTERGAANNPKIVLLDLKLPKMNGIEVIRKIKSDKKTKDIPVVVLTSSEEEKDVTESYGLGVNSYIVKPVDFTKFAKVVADAGLYWLLINKPPVV